HGDLDVEVLRRDHHLIHVALPHWEHHGAAGGNVTRWAAGDVLPETVNSVWSRPSSEDAWSIQFMLAEADGDDSVYRRERRARRAHRCRGCDPGPTTSVAPSSTCSRRARSIRRHAVALEEAVRVDLTERTYVRTMTAATSPWSVGIVTLRWSRCAREWESCEV